MGRLALLLVDVSSYPNVCMCVCVCVYIIWVAMISVDHVCVADYGPIMYYTTVREVSAHTPISHQPCVLYGFHSN